MWLPNRLVSPACGDARVPTRTRDEAEIEPAADVTQLVDIFRECEKVTLGK
jgi:hypothetical protein